MGKLFLVGLGPGGREYMTGRAVAAIKGADAVVGYKTYLELLGDLTSGKEVIASGMREEVERAKMAVRLAQEKEVALVSSGDPGVYAMASIVMEYLKENDIKLEIEVVPGVTAANASSALLGAPLGHDHVSISLSDLLTPWDIVEKRLVKACEGDFVVVLYNPKSSGRENQFQRAVEIMGKHRSARTPVGVVRRAMRDGEQVEITDLGELQNLDIDMFTTIIVGNSETFTYDGWMVTPRGYKGRGMKS